MTNELANPPKRKLIKSRRTPHPELQASAAPARWPPDEPLICPVNGSTSFARVPPLKLRGTVLFPAGSVQLRYGAHFGPNHGFGFRHIWREHFNHIEDHDVALRHVRASIANALRPGTEVRHDPVAGGPKVFVVRMGAGIVVMQHLGEGFPAIYSVVTGGFHPRENTKGSVIGALV